MNNGPSTLPSNSQKLLLALGEFPMDAIWRMAAGIAVIPLAVLFFGKKDSFESAVAGLLAVLLLTRLLPLLIRKLIPFPSSVQQVWSGRRVTGKKYDSYQWKKLLWIGIGMLSYLAASGFFWPRRVLIACACMFVGAMGMLRWQLISSKARQQRSKAA